MGPKSTFIIKNCKECNGEFKTNRSKKLFCNDTCRFKNWEKSHPRIKIGESK